MSDCDWTKVALQRLARVLGPDGAAAMVARTLEACGRTELDSVDALAAFGDALATQQGFVGAVGLSLRTHAELNGARPK